MLSQADFGEQFRLLAAGYDTVACEAAVADTTRFNLPEAMTTGKSYNVMHCVTHDVYHVYDAAAAALLREAVRSQLWDFVKSNRAEMSEALFDDLRGRVAASFAGQSALAREHRRQFSEWRVRTFQRVTRNAKRQRARQRQVAANEWVAQLSVRQQLEFYRCFRKQVFVFAWQAQVALATRPADVAAKLTAYSCEFCSGWHIGHAPRRQQEHEGAYLRKIQRSFLMYPVAARQFLESLQRD